MRAPRSATSAGAGLCGVAVLTLLFQAVTSHRIARAGGCGFDGADYCAMAEGRPAHLPFVRRVLVPALVRSLPVGPTVDRFLVVNVVAVLVCTVLIVLLTRQVFPGTPPAALLTVASLTLSTPSTWHLLLVDPVLVDWVALDLALAWLLLVLRGDLLVAVPVGALAVLARESWGPVVVVVLAVAVARPQTWPSVVQRRLALLGAAAAAAATGFAVTRSGEPYVIPTGLLPTARFWLTQEFGGPRGLVLTGVLVVTGVGLVGLSLVALPRATVGTPARRLVLAVALLNAVLGLVGGGDTDRLLLPTGLLLTALAVPLLLERGQVAALAVLSVASILLWRPWAVVGGDDRSFDAFFGLRAADSALRPLVLAVAATTLVAVALSLAIAARRTRTGVPEAT